MASEKFYRLCVFDGKKYAVETKGVRKDVGKAAYYISHHVFKDEWIVTFGFNGIKVGQGYDTAEAAAADVPNVHEKLRTLYGQGKKMPSKGILAEAEKISEKKYVRMIKEGEQDGE